MEDVEAWFKTLPYFTRHYMLGCLVATAASSLQLVSPDKLALSYDGLFKHYYVNNFFSNPLMIVSQNTDCLIGVDSSDKLLGCRKSFSSFLTQNVLYVRLNNFMKF